MAVAVQMETMLSMPGEEGYGMKRKIIVAAVVALSSGLAFAAGGTGSSEQQSGYQSQTGADRQMKDEGGAAGRADRAGEATPSVGGTAPVTEHQAEATREVTRRFEQLDTNRDDKINYEEAQAMPELKDYWEQHGKDKSAEMDQAEFAQFESQLQTGTDIYKSKQGGPEGLPATEHQKEAVEKGKSPGSPDSGTSGGMENRGD